ncbi:MAG: Crp/Fnr family transcriptional regulator [Sphingomonas sp.]
MTAEDRALLESVCEGARAVPARYDLIREGDKPGPVFIMLEGWACRYKLLPEGGRQIMAFLMPGDFCDMHVAVLDEMDHSIATLTPARVAAVPRGLIETLIDANSAITHTFCGRNLSTRGR